MCAEAETKVEVVELGTERGQARSQLLGGSEGRVGGQQLVHLRRA